MPLLATRVPRAAGRSTPTAFSHQKAVGTGSQRAHPCTAPAGLSHPVVQRLGYLLDRTGHGELSGELVAFVAKNKPKMVALEPRSEEAVSARDQRWRILVNTTIEVEA